MTQKESKVSNKETGEKKGGFGVLSLVAMLLGGMIGAGIYVKNSSLLGINGDIWVSIGAWIVSGLVAISILIAFLEILSITEIAGKSNIFSNWGQMLYNKRFGKYMGLYFTYVNLPLLGAALFTFGGQKIISIIQMMDPNFLAGMAYAQQGMIFGLSFVMLVVVGYFVSNSTKAGKGIANTGMALKLIPLLIGIILFVVAVFASITQGGIGIDFNPQYSDGTGSIAGNKGSDSMYNGMNGFVLLLVTVPSTLFAFEGFLFAGSLSSEAKTPTTFKTAFVLSMVGGTILYILFALSVFGITGDHVAEMTHKQQKDLFGSVTFSLYAMFGVNSGITALAVFIEICIFASIFSCGTSYIISALRMQSDLSATETVVDKNGKFLQRGKGGVAPMSGYTIVGIIGIYWLIMQGLDFVTIAALGPDAGTAVITDTMSSVIIVGSFSIYLSLIIGQMINRKKEKVEYKKNPVFLVAAIFAIILMVFITGFTIVTTFVPLGYIDSGKQEDLIKWGIVTAGNVIVIISAIIIPLVHIRATEKMDDKFFAEKAKMAEAYYASAE